MSDQLKYDSSAIDRLPVTDIPPSIRERLARALTQQAYRSIFRSQSELEVSVNNDWEMNLPLVDAILTELQEPSEGMIIAGVQHEHIGDMRGRWQAMIQYIKDGGS